MIADNDAVKEIIDFILRQSEPSEVKEIFTKIISKRSTRADVLKLANHYARNFAQAYQIKRKRVES